MKSTRLSPLAGMRRTKSTRLPIILGGSGRIVHAWVWADHYHAEIDNGLDEDCAPLGIRSGHCGAGRSG
ncbi:hypothetical protein [Chromobacterium sphagni]|uniref:hypothetical protein n=1 Tax=Chromobacterium sphagni TaxID=1903179 RepID=UPI0011142DBB|nr:hypothetical protein [Chromobacterium sphagni]